MSKNTTQETPGLVQLDKQVPKQAQSTKAVIEQGATKS